MKAPRRARPAAPRRPAPSPAATAPSRKLPLGPALERLDQAVGLVDEAGLVRWCNPPLAECYLRRHRVQVPAATPWQRLFGPLFPAMADWARIEAAREEARQCTAGRAEVLNAALDWGGPAPRRVDLVICRLDRPPSRDGAGWMAWYFNDVTSRRNAEETLEEQLRLSRKLATLGELASAVAHEIKNPLGIIVSAAEIVMNPGRPEEQRRQAATFILEEAKRLDERLQSFLKFSRPKPPSFQAQNIHRVLTQTIIAYQTLAREGLKLLTRFAPSLPHVRIDADQMQQVFLNLLLNADQAMPVGGTITITTRLAPLDAEAMIQIEIADEGIGLPEGPTSRLFEPFFSTKPQGTGLGLTTSMQIVTAHRGTIDARSRQGGGASLVVMLPAARGPVEPAAGEG